MITDNEEINLHKPALAGVRVLVVDDISLMRNILKTTLRGFGFDQFDDAANGEEAVTRFRTTKYGMVFLDIDMPGKSGLEALSEIRNYDAEVFVVIVSAHSSAENVKHALKLGADGFIVKPYAAQKVAQLVAKYIRKSPDFRKKGN